MSASLADVFPASVFGALQRALPTFDRQVAGYFTDEAIVVATESRSSSPVRIERDRRTCESPSHPGLFPCGEGAEGKPAASRAQDLTGSGRAGDLSATWRLFMINLVTLCALVISAPSAPPVTRSASWSDVALAGGVAAAFFAVHAQDEPFFDWRWEDSPETSRFRRIRSPPRRSTPGAALTAAIALEGGSKLDPAPSTPSA